jgi:hypothetical protein
MMQAMQQAAVIALQKMIQLNFFEYVNKKLFNRMDV